MAAAVEAVLYDAVGTLIVPTRPVAGRHAGFGRRHGFDIADDDIARRFHAAFQAEEHADALDPSGRTDEARERRRWRNIVARVFTPQATSADGVDHVCEPLFDELWNYFADPDAWRPRTPVVERLRHDAAEGRTVGIASNFDARLLPIARHWMPEVEASRVFVSSLIGRRKPALGFFRACEARLGLRPEQIRLVGDDRRNDYEGARAAGWHVELISP